jgi:nucleotide-binding universal stress UspA family protein
VRGTWIIENWKEEISLEKRILVAVDDSAYSRKAVEYAVEMGSVIKDLCYTLFNVQPTISEYLLKDAHVNPKARAALKEVTKKNHVTSTKLLDELKSQMIKKGVDEKCIDAVTRPKIMGTAKDILNHGKQCLCDAIVLGRSGVSRLEEAFLGSVANSVLEHSRTTPIWATGNNLNSLKIMMAIDGSESSLSAVDHLSFMLEGNQDIKVTLLHVTPRLKDYCTIEFDEEGEILEYVIAEGSKKCVESFYIHAQQRFRDAGIKESQIDIQEVKSTVNVAKTIVDEAEKGGYGTVVVGRRGMNQSFFMGSVSRRVLNKASNFAVWLVP